jgi:hypothetical protein
MRYPWALQFFDYAEAENRFFAVIVENMQPDQTGILVSH